MRILSEMPTGYGKGKWHIAEYEDGFFAWGTETDKTDLYGYPVDQCGSKESVLNSLKGRAKLCKKHIEKYVKEKQKDNTDGWNILIGHEQKELEAVEEFVRVLEQIEQ